MNQDEGLNNLNQNIMIDLKDFDQDNNIQMNYNYESNLYNNSAQFSYNNPKESNQYYD